MSKRLANDESRQASEGIGVTDLERVVGDTQKTKDTRRTETNSELYLDAVKKGDVPLAEALMLEHAYSKGFELAEVYHGTRSDEAFE